MTLTRRSFIQSTTLVGAVGGTVAYPMVAEAAASQPYDPLLEAIYAYRAGWQAFLAIPEDEAGAHMHLWRAPHSILANWARGCASREGAVEALRTAITENEGGDSLLTEPMMRAALSYLDGCRS